MQPSLRHVEFAVPNSTYLLIQSQWPCPKDYRVLKYPVPMGRHPTLEMAPSATLDPQRRILAERGKKRPERVGVVSGGVRETDKKGC